MRRPTRLLEQPAVSNGKPVRPVGPLVSNGKRGYPLPRLVREALESAGFESFEALCSATGIKPDTLYRARFRGRSHGRLSPELAQKIADALGLGADEVRWLLLDGCAS